jgi:putative tricarboxylic transport membrane protein
VLWGSPFTVVLYIVLAGALVVSLVQHLRHRRRAALEAKTVAVRLPDPVDAER